MLLVISMAMAAGDVLLLLDEMEESIRRIVSSETERGVDYGEFLLEAEILLQDVLIVSDLLPMEDGETLLMKFTIGLNVRAGVLLSEGVVHKFKWMRTNCHCCCHFVSLVLILQTC